MSSSRPMPPGSTRFNPAKQTVCARGLSEGLRYNAGYPFPEYFREQVGRSFERLPDLHGRDGSCGG
jgi:hypothetical protein